MTDKELVLILIMLKKKKILAIKKKFTRFLAKGNIPKESSVRALQQFST